MSFWNTGPTLPPVYVYVFIKGMLYQKLHTYCRHAKEVFCKFPRMCFHCSTCHVQAKVPQQHLVDVCSA